jgi:hypothetical protein
MNRDSGGIWRLSDITCAFCLLPVTCVPSNIHRGNAMDQANRLWLFPGWFWFGSMVSHAGFVVHKFTSRRGFFWCFGLRHDLFVRQPLLFPVIHHSSEHHTRRNPPSPPQAIIHQNTVLAIHPCRDSSEHDTCHIPQKPLFIIAPYWPYTPVVIHQSTVLVISPRSLYTPCHQSSEQYTHPTPSCTDYCSPEFKALGEGRPSLPPCLVAMLRMRSTFLEHKITQFWTR